MNNHGTLKLHFNEDENWELKSKLVVFYHDNPNGCAFATFYSSLFSYEKAKLQMYPAQTFPVEYLLGNSFIDLRVLKVYIHFLLISWRIYDYVETNILFSTSQVTLVNNWSTKLKLTKIVKIIKYINRSATTKKFD